MRTLFIFKYFKLADIARMLYWSDRALIAAGRHRHYRTPDNSRKLIT